MTVRHDIRDILKSKNNLIKEWKKAKKQFEKQLDEAEKSEKFFEKYFKDKK